MPRPKTPRGVLRTAATLVPVTLSLTAGATAAPVINEIHYNNEDNSVRNEFVEIYNPDAEPVDLSGWQLAGGIDFTFPAPTTLAAGEFIVVAEDPATVAGSIGPYTGGLSGDGEEIQLLDAGGVRIDRVNYGVDFPWPTAADGGGSSMELVNPALDNNLGSSWRSSSTGFSGGPSHYIAAEEIWRYRKGTSEASDPIGDWRGLAFVEDETWLDGQTPIGRGDNDDNTVLADMQGNYASVFLRKTFTVDGEIPPRLTLRLYYDDGAIVWLNGTEIARTPSVSPGEVDYLANLPGQELPLTGGAVGSHEAGANGWEDFAIEGTAALLNPGQNVLAIQMLNDSIGSSDTSIDAELIPPLPFAELSPPSPGAPNAVASPIAAPNIRQVNHAPAQPTTAEPAVITAKVTDPEGVGSVELEYQPVTPGAYVPAFIAKTTAQLLADPTGPREPNPAYQTGWTSMAMVDDGTGGDLIAGDDIYAATIPAQATNRTLVRYRIRVADVPGEAVTVPYADDESLNFAYFVYDGVPDFVAAERSVTGTVPTVHSAEALTALPTYHLLTTEEDFDQCVAYNQSDQIRNRDDLEARSAFNWSGTFVYDGVVYDNMKYRLRQRNARYSGNGKRSFRFRFNRGNYVQFHDNEGEPYPTKWRTLNSHKMTSSRGNKSFGLYEGISEKLWNLVGSPAPYTHWFHFRVVAGEDEQPTGTNGQHLGDFYGLLLAMEDYDSRFLEAHDLEDGNLYKLKTRGEDGKSIQRYQAKDAVTDASDFLNIINNLRSSQSEAWMRQHVDWDSYYLYHAIVDAVRHYDVSSGINTNNGEHLKNRAYYFAPDPGNPLGKLHLAPWDADTSWGPNWNGGWDWPKNAMSNKLEFNKEYKNVVREIRDLVWQEDQLNPLLDHWEDRLADFVLADRDRWTGGPHPNYSNTDTLASLIQDMKVFAFTGGKTWTGGTWNGNGGELMRDYVFSAPGTLTSSWISLDNEVNGGQQGSGLSGQQGRDAYLDTLGADPDIPDTPTLTDLSAAGHPTNMLMFESSAFSDTGGAFAAMEYRIAQVNAAAAPVAETPLLEWDASWESGELTTFTAQITPPASAARGGLTYRARVRHMDDTGRWSHWSTPVEFVASEPDISHLQESLVISEIMYNPAGGGDHEFIEIKNIGPAELDLTDVRFTKGVDFDFAPGTKIASGAYLLVVKNAAAFDAHYGAGKPVAGEYQFEDENALSNGGERIKLALGALAIHDFGYSDDPPWPNAADGDGFSLVLARTSDNAAADPLDPLGHGVAMNWRSSAMVGGTPGGGDSETFVGDPDRDGDNDGLSAFLEHALAGDDGDPAAGAGLLTTGVAGDMLTLSFKRNLLADDAAFTVQVSTDMRTWNSEGATRIDDVSHDDGTATVTFGADTAVPENGELFLRLFVEQVVPLP